MSGIYKNVDSAAVETNTVPWSGTGYNAVSGSNLTFTMAQSDPNNGRPFSNLFSSFRLPMIAALSGGTWPFGGTNFNGLNADKICVISIASEQYGELIDGRTVKLVIPTGQTNGGSGPTTAPGTIELYSSYTVGENWNSDNTAAGSRFGNPINLGTASPEDASTNVAFLFSDQLYPPQSPDHSTWTNGYPSAWANMGSTKPTDTPSAYPGNASNTSYYNILQTYNSGATGVLPKTPALSNYSDTPVGIVYLDKGMAVITDQSIITNLLLSGMTSYVFSSDTSNYGNTGSIFGYTGDRDDVTLGAYTASTSARCEFYSFEKEYILSVLCVAGENEFYSTSNPTAAPYSQDGAGGAATAVSGVYDLQGAQAGGQDYSAYITELGLYDQQNNLLAVAKPDRPIEKPKTSQQTFTLKFKF